MPNLMSRSVLTQRLAAAFQSHEGVLAAVGAEPPKLPDGVKKWLTRLMQLSGVPINYLVPDEAMLPPESIRFFHLDVNWIAALIDGAFSIGRNLSTQEHTPTMHFDT